MLRIRLARGLTFDMRGGRKQAKLACGRPLDGRVRPMLHACARGAQPIFHSLPCQPKGYLSYWTWSVMHPRLLDQVLTSAKRTDCSLSVPPRPVRLLARVRRRLLPC